MAMCSAHVSGAAGTSPAAARCWRAQGHARMAHVGDRAGACGADATTTPSSCRHNRQYNPTPWHPHTPLYEPLSCSTDLTGMAMCSAHVSGAAGTSPAAARCWRAQGHARMAHVGDSACFSHCPLCTARPSHPCTHIKDVHSLATTVDRSSQMAAAAGAQTLYIDA
jgi:hypothetical protein